jgi:hypothetical protein
MFVGAADHTTVACSSPKYRTAAAVLRCDAVDLADLHRAPDHQDGIWPGGVIDGDGDRITAVQGDALGAPAGLAITISLPFQWNQIGLHRGVPSVQVYARWASCCDVNNR